MTIDDDATGFSPTDSLVGGLLLVALSVVVIALLTRGVRRGPHPSAAPRPWLPEVAFLALAIFLACTFAVPALVVRLLGGEGGDPDPALGVAATAVANVLGIALTLLVARRRYGATWPDLALGRPSALALAFGVVAILAALPGFLGASVVNLRLVEALGLERYQALVRSLLEDREFLSRPWVLASIVLVVPFCEEVLFRGFLQRALRVALPASAAIAGSAFLFAVVHDPQSLLPVFAVGLALGLIVEVTDSVWAATAAHGVFNAVNLVQIAVG